MKKAGYNDVFNDDIQQETDKSIVVAPKKYPITFILEQDNFQIWEDVKAKLKTRDDKTAFLKLIGGCEAC